MKRILIPVFPNVQALDVVGPAEVFSLGTRLGQHEYALELVATSDAAVQASSGMQLVPDRTVGRTRGSVDTLVIPGGEGTRAALNDAALIGWIGRMAARARRVASVCTGAFLLAEAGLLDGRRATTHWSACSSLSRRYPTVDVQPDPIFVRDGNVWTSAGVTAGMDLALALLEEDAGAEVALAVARQLVMFVRRPGGQTQFSVQLSAGIAEREPIRDAQQWIAQHPADDLSVEALASRVHMSPRNFARAFKRELGITPAAYVERVRVEQAQHRLEAPAASLQEVARICGFGSEDRMRRAFRRCLAVGPAGYRDRFRSPLTKAA